MSLLIFKGNQSPSLSDTIKVNDVAFDLTGSTVKLRMRLETSATLKIDTAAAIVTPAAGTVRYDWQAADVDTAGRYVAWWEVTLPGGNVQATDEFLVEIRDHVNAETGLLCSRSMVREYLGKDTDQRIRDTELAALITRASVEIENYCSRDLADKGTQTRRFQIRERCLRFPFGDLRTPTLVRLHPEAPSPVTLTLDATSTGYRMFRSSPYTIATYSGIEISNDTSLASDYAYRYGVAQLDITGSWGPTSTPADVQMAAIITVARWFQQGGVQGIRTVDANLGDDGGRVLALPGAAERLVAPYRRMVFA